MLNGTDRFSDEISFADDDVVTSAPSPRERQAIPVVRDTQPTQPATPYAKTTTRTQADEAGRVDAEGAKRAAADEALARSLGFSPKPPVFEIGTTVNSIGVENFKRSRQDWAQQPALPELAKSFTDRIAAEQREDSVVTAMDLRAHPDGRLGLYAGDTLKSDWLTSERALDGLATHVTPGGSSYLKQCPSDLRAANLNHWLGKAERLDARATKKAGEPIYKPQQLTLRTRARKGGKREIYSVVGPKYAAFNVDRVAREAAAGIGGDARGVITYDGYKMTLDAMFHSNIAPERAVAGEFFKGCVRVQAADDGSGSVKVSLGLWRNLCRNLIIVDFNKVLVGSRKHVGAATIEEDIRELMVQANERIGLIVGKWSEASTEDVLARYDLTDVDQVFEGLVLNGCVHAPNVRPEDMVKRLHESWEREPGYSKTAILNAITRAAHEHTWSSWADTEELESQAGELLYQKVWTLDTGSRSAEEILA
jgi:hypothetical protein